MTNKKAEQLLNIPGGIVFRVFILFLLISPCTSSQVKTNMELFYALIDSSAGKALSELPDNTREIALTTSLGDTYSIFNNRINAVFDSKNIKTNGNNPRLNFVIDDAKVTYGEMFRSGLFGEYLVSREVRLQGNYLLDGSSTKLFSFSLSDTVNIEDVNNYESFSYPFTQGELPTEPFFSGLFEPIVAISAAAAAVILFFTVRSH